MLPRPAATVLLVRDGDEGVEVLMLERRLESGFVPGAWVFPGGGIDPLDEDESVHAHTDGPTDAEVPGQSPSVTGDLAHRIAAVRETFEEAGVLLARHADGGRPEPGLVERLQTDRHGLEVGDLTVSDLCRRHDLVLATAGLRPFAHWITPEGPPRRYDTRFYLAPAPEGQPATPCGREATGAHWISPARALRRGEAGDLWLIQPTERCLRAVAGFVTVDALLDAADEAVSTGPRWVADRGGTRLALRSVDAPVHEGSAA